MCPVLATPGDRPEFALGAAGGRQIVPAVAQILSCVLAFDMSPEQAFLSPRIDASGPIIRVNRSAPPDVVTAIAAEFDIQIIDDSLYPVNFAVPSAVLRRDENNIGMVHPRNPWAAVREASQ